MAGPSQVPAQKGNAVEALLGEEAELVRQVREQGGNIHVAGMVGDEDVCPLRVELFHALDAHADEAHGQQHLAPEPREVVRRIAGAVERTRRAWK